ncbi:MAG: ATP-binding protein, partial [Acetobacteraceae bacterium]
LPLWSRDLAALATCPLPLGPDQEQRAALRDDAAKARERALTEARDLAEEAAALEDEISRLSRGEAVPTPDAVKAAREIRDRVWRRLRRAHEGGPAVSAPAASADEREKLPPGPLPELFEQLRDAADRLADRRADEAQRVSDFLAAGARLALLAERREKAALRRAECEHALEAAEAGWQALWAPAGLVPGTKAAMSEWRRARERVLALAAAEAELRAKAYELSSRRDRARLRLAPLLAGPAEPETLTALLLRAETDCAAREARQKQYEALSQAFADHEEQLPALDLVMQRAADELAEWQQAWASAAAALGLPEDATIDLGLSALAAWDRIAETAPAWRTDERRITDMQASIAGFEERVHAVEASLGEPSADEPPIVIAARLARRLTAARSAAEKSLLLERRIAGHEEAERNAIRNRNDAEAELESLRRIAGAADDAMLEQAIARARTRDALRERIAGLEEGLLKQGDGMSEATLSAEATAADPDAAKARIDEIEAELSDLNDRREQLSAERTAGAAALAAMHQGHDAAAKAQDAENALADAGTAAERYVRLHIARVLLRAGIDRFRKEQQGPFLRAAGAHFAALTGARY